MGLALGDEGDALTLVKEPLGESPQNGERKKERLKTSLFRDPFGARTQDPNIKSVVLYRLS